MEYVNESLMINSAIYELIMVDLLKGMFQMLLGEQGDTLNPLANTLKANYQDFPRLYINVESTEAIFYDAIHLAAIAKKDGINVTLSVIENKQHVFPCLAGRAQEADAELAKIAKWLKGETSVCAYVHKIFPLYCTTNQYNE